MKLYVQNRKGEKIALDISASTKAELAAKIGSSRFYIQGEVFDVSDVWAETDDIDLIGGAILGSIVGILEGPIGLVIGGVVGGALGKKREHEEIIKASKFNHSVLV